MDNLRSTLARWRDTRDRAARALEGPLRTRYPAFLFGLPLPKHEVPIFNFHEVTAEELEPNLQYLRENGYTTLNLRDFMRATKGGARQRRAVLLTFDDAWESFWSIAYPLLRKYDLRAVLFAPTHWVDGNGPDGLFMSWDQIRECAASGLVEVQSHAHRHALVHTGDRLLGFANPDTLERTHFFNWPMRDADGAGELGPPPPGTPYYRALPLLSAAQRYVENPETVRQCRAFVAEQNAAFFSRPGAEAELRRRYEEVHSKYPGRWATQDEIEQQMRFEFDKSRERFEEELGHAPEYFAYPWMLGNRRSMELARRSGMIAAFGVGVDFRTARRPGLPLPIYGRLKGDWLRCLPGKGRMHALPVLAGKLRRITTPQNLAH